MKLKRCMIILVILLITNLVNGKVLVVLDNGSTVERTTVKVNSLPDDGNHEAGILSLFACPLGQIFYLNRCRIVSSG